MWLIYFLSFIFLFYPEGSLEISRWKGDARICIHPDSPWNTISFLWSHLLWLPIWNISTHLPQEAEQDSLSEYSKFRIAFHSCAILLFIYDIFTFYFLLRQKHMLSIISIQHGPRNKPILIVWWSWLII